MSKTFFTADTHFSHANIIRHCGRPWLDKAKDLVVIEGEEQWASKEIKAQRAAQMDEVLRYNWNSVVGPNDIVYHLGDYCWGKTEEDFLRHFKRLNGKVHFLRGNHDGLAWEHRHHFASASEGHPEIKVNGQRIVICHYALRVWDESHYGIWHLYGHSHGALSDLPDSLSFDVGVDCHNFTPISFEQVEAIMARKNFRPLKRKK